MLLKTASTNTVLEMLSFHSNWWQWTIQKEHDSDDFFTNISLEFANMQIAVKISNLQAWDWDLQVRFIPPPPPPPSSSSTHPFAPKCPTLTYPSLPNSPKKCPKSTYLSKKIMCNPVVLFHKLPHNFLWDNLAVWLKDARKRTQEP